MTLTNSQTIELVTYIMVFLFSSLVAIMLLSEKGFKKGSKILSFIRWYLLNRRKHRYHDEEISNLPLEERRSMVFKEPWLLKPKVPFKPMDPGVVPGKKEKSNS